MKNEARTSSASTVPETGNSRGKRNLVGQKGVCFLGKLKIALSTQNRKLMRGKLLGMSKKAWIRVNLFMLKLGKSGFTGDEL